MMLGLLAIGWIVYLALHSVLALDAVKAGIKISPRSYRIGYVIFSTIGLVALMWWGSKLPYEYFFNSTGIVRYMSLMLTTFGVMTIQLSFRHYNFRSFIGLKEEAAVLKTTGLLHYVRHPIYSGLILVTIGFFLFIPNLPSLIASGCIFLYLPIGIYLEEKKLLALFGDAYRQYKQDVPAVLPRIPFGGKS
jgi:uncharacterized membrane protein